MGPIETSDEVYFLNEKLKFHNFNVSIMALISRRAKSAAINKLIDCYGYVALDHRIEFAEHKKFTFFHMPRSSES